MSFYSDIAARALDLLKRFGRPVTLRRYTPGGGNKYDPSTGKAVANAQTSQQDTTRYAVVVDAPGKRIGPEYGENFKTNTLIQDHNKWMYMDANGDAPRIQDFVLLGSVQYKIYDVQAISPGGTDLLYLLVLRA
jgi:hypothetical protein